MPEPLSVTSVITLALGSSVVGSALTQGMTWFKDARSNRREAAYLALRLATKFEKYAEDAAGIIGDMEDHQNSGGSHGGYAGSVPSLDTLPDEKERWRDLPTGLSARVLGFEPYRRSKQASIDNCFDVVGSDEGYEEVRRESAKLGMRALDLAAALRQEFNLPAQDRDWNWAEYLRKRA